MIVFCFYFKLIEPEWADRSLVSSEVKISTRLENSEFISLLRSAGFLYPDHEHVYWRIGATMTLNELDYFRDKSKSQSAISYENGPNILIHGVKNRFISYSYKVSAPKKIGAASVYTHNTG